VEQAKATWTDQRLDDMAHRMDDGFSRVYADIRALRGEMSALHSEISDLRFEARLRTIRQLGGGMIVLSVAGFASILVAQLA
jgi:hypothetical protein